MNKLEVSGAFVKFYACVENQFHTKIKVFQCDGGGECYSDIFKDYLDANWNFALCVLYVHSLA